MHLAFRPYVTTGVALVGATVIAAAPMQPVVPADIQITNPAVQAVERGVQLTANEIQTAINNAIFTFVANRRLPALNCWEVSSNLSSERIRRFYFPSLRWGLPDRSLAVEARLGPRSRISSIPTVWQSSSSTSSAVLARSSTAWSTEATDPTWRPSWAICLRRNLIRCPRRRSLQTPSLRWAPCSPGDLSTSSSRSESFPCFLRSSR